MGMNWMQQKIIEHEGYRTEPYKDTLGYLTGGIGHKFTESDFKNFDTSWSKERKDQYWAERFEEDFAKAHRQAISIANKRGIDTTERNLYVLTDMVFNLGADGVNKFNNFLTFLSERETEKAITEMMYTDQSKKKKSKWYTQVPNRVQSLVEILRSENGSSK